MGLSVEVGMKLVKTDSPGYILEVLEFIKPDGETPHARARVSLTGHDLGIRLYSISALGDPRLFTPMANAPTT